jgi:hypothetical protein
MSFAAHLQLLVAGTLALRGFGIDGVPLTLMGSEQDAVSWDWRRVGASVGEVFRRV